MTRRLRAARRLLGCAAQALRGLALVRLRFGRLSPAERHERIRTWSLGMLATIGVGLRVEGDAPAGAALLVANHVSWLDVLALHAVCPQARFVSKAEIKRWPLLGRLVDAGGTLYLARERKRDALRVVHLVAEALRDGEVVAVFPEGTTSDGRSLLPFHANLMQAAISAGVAVQPVALRYADAHGRFSRAVEFVGATTLAQSVWRVACGDGLTVQVTLLPPRDAASADRRALALRLREDVAAVLRSEQGPFGDRFAVGRRMTIAGKRGTDDRGIF